MMIGSVAVNSLDPVAAAPPTAMLSASIQRGVRLQQQLPE